MRKQNPILVLERELVIADINQKILRVMESPIKFEEQVMRLTSALMPYLTKPSELKQNPFFDPDSDYCISLEDIPVSLRAVTPFLGFNRQHLRYRKRQLSLACLTREKYEQFKVPELHKVFKIHANVDDYIKRTEEYYETR